MPLTNDLDNSTYIHCTRFENVRPGQTFVEDGWRYVRVSPPAIGSAFNARLVAQFPEYASFAPDDWVYVNNKVGHS